MIDYRARAFVDWAGGGYIEAEQLLDWQISRGRSNANDQVAAGTCTFRVIDDLGVYTPRNAAGPLYGLLLPDKPMYLALDIDGYGEVVLFTGQTSAIGTSNPHGEMWATPINCGDAFDRFRLGSIRTGVLEGLRPDEVIDEILDEAEWTGARDLDPSSVTIGRIWWYRTNPLEAILQAAKNSLGGHAFVTREGAVAFRDYTWRATQTSHMTITGGKALDTELRREDFIDKVRLKRAGIDVATGYTSLWQLAPPGRVVYSGATHPDNTWHFTYGVGGKDVQEPEPYTDYIFNSEPDGSGTDKTPQVTVESFTSYGGGGTIVWRGLDASPVYAMVTNVRGQAVRRSSDERTIEVEALSPVVSGQTFSIDFEFMDDASRIRAFANFKAASLNTGQTRIQLPVFPKDNAELYALATLDFGSRVTLDIPAAWLEGDWFVEKIAIAGPRDKGAPPTFTLTLFPADAVGGKLFRISGSPGGGQDYSTIAAAGAASDRIAY